MRSVAMAGITRDAMARKFASLTPGRRMDAKSHVPPTLSAYIAVSGAARNTAASIVPNTRAGSLPSDAGWCRRYWGARAASIVSHMRRL